MPRSVKSVLFSGQEIREILAREAGMTGEIEIEGWDEDDQRFGTISELRVSQTADHQTVYCRSCNEHPANTNGDLLCDFCENPEPESDPDRCRACNQNQVRQIKTGKDPSTNLPLMKSAPDGLCHFCKNPE